jgi:3-oxoacyl-[acyl-carrier-protein] synthase-1
LVAALGAVTSLGYDAPTAYAGARAQLSRASVLPNYRARSGVEGDEEPVIGHAVDLLTQGFEGEARLQRLAQGALADLLAAGLDPTLWQRRVGLYLARPDPRRTETGTELLAEDDPPPSADEGDDLPDPEEFARRSPEALGIQLAQQALRLAAWPGLALQRHMSMSGHCAGIEVLAAAATDLAQGAVEVAVVLAVDSLLDEDTLRWLNRTGRLKCDAAPTGLRPGEAAVALALLPSRDAPLLRPPHTQLTRMAFDLDERPLIDGGVSIGDSLARALDAALAGPVRQPPWLLSDHNGEVYRANEWGCALTRLRAGHPGFDALDAWYPALSFGDTGAASALLAVGMVLQAHARGYAPAPAALIAASSEGAHRAALLLHTS